jgi:glutamate racemase
VSIFVTSVHCSKMICVVIGRMQERGIMMTEKNKIGIFDSGIGGFTVLYQALKILPDEDYLYYADTKHVPYGEKSKDEVKSYVFEAVDFMVKKNVQAIVIACNTATGAAADDVRKAYNIPILGIEPAVKPALEIGQRPGKRVLVLATRLTLQQERYHQLVARLDSDHIADGVPLPGLVEFAEKFQFDEKIVLPYLIQAFSGLDLNQYSTVVLGCTHFPLFKDMLQKLFPPQTAIIDGSVGTVKNLKRTLEGRQALLHTGSGAIEYYLSGVKVEEKKKIQQYSQLFDRLNRIL